MNYIYNIKSNADLAVVCSGFIAPASIYNFNFKLQKTDVEGLHRSARSAFKIYYFIFKYLDTNLLLQIVNTNIKSNFFACCRQKNEYISKNIKSNIIMNSRSTFDLTLLNFDATNDIDSLNFEQFEHTAGAKITLFRLDTDDIIPRNFHVGVTI